MHETISVAVLRGVGYLGLPGSYASSCVLPVNLAGQRRSSPGLITLHINMCHLRRSRFFFFMSAFGTPLAHVVCLRVAFVKLRGLTASRPASPFHLYYLRKGVCDIGVVFAAHKAQACAF